MLPEAALLGVAVADVVFAVGLGAGSVWTVPLLGAAVSTAALDVTSTVSVAVVVVVSAVDAAEASAWGVY